MLFSTGTLPKTTNMQQKELWLSCPIWGLAGRSSGYIDWSKDLLWQAVATLTSLRTSWEKLWLHWLNWGTCWDNCVIYTDTYNQLNTAIKQLRTVRTAAEIRTWAAAHCQFRTGRWLAAWLPTSSRGKNGCPGSIQETFSAHIYTHVFFMHFSGVLR